MFRIVALALLFSSSGALAHDGVKDPAVMARMDLMSGIGKATETLGKMAKGDLEFDAAEANAARADLVRYLSETPARFEGAASDPKSEALPVIWEDWDGFVAANADAISSAEQIGTGSLDALRASMGPLGQSCTACHETFRQD